MAMTPFQVPDRFNAAAFFVDRHIAEDGVRGEIVVPDAVMHRLEVPDPLAGLCFHADEALG